MTIRSIATLLLVATVVYPDSSVAQSVHAQGHGVHDGTLTITADGRANPSHIDDETALMHFLASVAPSPADPPHRALRAKRLTESLGLGEADRRVWLNTLAELGSRLSHINDSIRRTSDAGDVLHTQPATRDKAEFLRQSARSVLAAVSPDGRHAIEEFLLSNVKPRIIVYGTTSK
jgi:hypothetical protein